MLLSVDWLREALGAPVESVERTGSSRTIAEKVRFVVTVDDRPIPICAKGHFGDGLRSLLTEAHAYRDLHPEVEVRAPVAHYVGIDDASGRGLILMDDVVALGGRFFDPGAAYPLDACRDALGQLARLHAATWNDARWEVEWLGPRIDHMVAMFPTDTLQRLLDDGRAEGLPAVVRDATILRAAMARAAEAPATCVIHGDTHSGNAYLDADGRLCWLDWQITQRGHWATDVSYHLGTVLDVDTRRAHEAGLLRHYLDELATAGVEAPAFAEAWEAYATGFVWGWFLWCITSVSSRAVVLVHVPRLGAALTDHDTLRRLGVV